MKPAQYSVLRYIADPARNEPMNIGVVVWTDESFAVRLDDAAVDRVIRDHPNLAKDALLHVEGFIKEQLQSYETPAPAVERCISDQRGYPVLWSDVLNTSVDERISEPEAVSDTVERLLTRIVHPRRRYGSSPPNSMEMLQARLRPLLTSDVVVQHHFFDSTRTGKIRTVDFFVNSNRNIALDVVRLAVKRSDEITRRADAEAFKIWDILGKSSGVNQYWVLCEFNPAEEAAEANADARKVLEFTNAKIITDVNEAAEQMEHAAAAEPATI